MEDLIKRAAEDIAAADCICALTGAGISVESGIPHFRGKGGIWEKIDPMKYAHIDAFLSDPVEVWNVLIKDMKEIIDVALPNAGHMGLARLEQWGKLKTVITQNVDGLHQKAGNKDVVEFHGTFAWHSCMDCRKRIDTRHIDLVVIPPRCDCGGIYRPDVIFFGEMIPRHALFQSQKAATECDIMLVIGTSAVVHPAASMPIVAKENGAKIIEINPEETPLTPTISDYHIMGPAGEVMGKIVEELEKMIA